MMLGTLLIVMTVFLFIREPAIDNMPRRKLRRRTFWGNVYEAITASSHHPMHPAESTVVSDHELIPATAGPVNSLKTKAQNSDDHEQST